MNEQLNKCKATPGNFIEKQMIVRDYLRVEASDKRFKQSVRD